VPSGVAEIEEGEVVLFLLERVGVDARGQLRAGMATQRTILPDARARLAKVWRAS